jgi:hypothetical protein
VKNSVRGEKYNTIFAGVHKQRDVFQTHQHGLVATAFPWKSLDHDREDTIQFQSVRFEYDSRRERSNKNGDRTEPKYVEKYLKHGIH